MSELRVSEVLEKALELLGPNGENWIKGAWWNQWPQPNKFCSLGVIRFTCDCGLVMPSWEAMEPLKNVIGTNTLAEWNDAPERTFPEVKAAFEKAIALARSEEKPAEENS